MGFTEHNSDGTGTFDSAVGVALFTGVSSTTGVDSLELLQPIPRTKVLVYDKDDDADAGWC